jgi:phosphoribosylformylglycinamidine cyclo-ligase
VASGGFAGLFDASTVKGYDTTTYLQPLQMVLAQKRKLHDALGKYDTIGEDLVAMVVDDLVVCGAEPLFMTDYIAVGKVVPERYRRYCCRHCTWLRKGWIQL